MSRRLLRVGLLWSQFSAYHVDRLQAVGRRLEGRAEVIAVEVTSHSQVYAWAPSEEVKGTRKIRLFSDIGWEDIGILRRWWAEFRALRRCDVVFVGIGYNEGDALLLCFALRLVGVRVVMMTASKWDDRPRRILAEVGKGLLLSGFSAALVGGARQKAYVRFLGFRRRPVLCGYNTVDMQRIRSEAAALIGEGQPAFADRPFVFVGRFVAKKQIEGMILAYAGYAKRVGARAHRLLMVGSGDLEPQLRQLCVDLGVSDLVDWPGFLAADEVAARLANGLALLLVSREEQWGLVVNEALGVALPVIVSAQIGAREALARNLENGYVVMPGSIHGIRSAMEAIASDEQAWEAMSRASAERAWIADSERFADAVEILVFPDDCAAARQNYARFEAEIIPPLSNQPD